VDRDVGSVQLGAAIAKGLFDALGPGGTVFLRIIFAALLLIVLWRPRLRGYPRSGYLVAILFGLVLAGMNFSIYLSFDRIPLGIAVTIAFIGPLGVAVAGSRRLLDLLWVALAAAGILLLVPLGILGSVDLDPVGVVFAVLAGCLWAAYILLSARTGQIFPGGTGLVIAMWSGRLSSCLWGLRVPEPRSSTRSSSSQGSRSRFSPPPYLTPSRWRPSGACRPASSASS
jgi:inner membrane transporter RhtA